MEETIAGFKTRGRWSEIVEHGERITRALREEGIENEYPEAFEEWEEWRPKPHERIDTDVSEKTAAQVSVEKGPGEEAGKTAEEDLRTAGDRLAESYERLEGADTDGAVDKWNESLEYVARAADSAGRKALRTVENTVYRRVMTQLAPYFFDNELISANLQRTRRGNEPGFIFEVNVNDDELKERVSERLADYADRMDRWHVGAEKEVETARAAEGHDVSEAEIKASSAVPAEEQLEEAIEPEVDRPEVIEGEHPEKDVPPGLAEERAANGEDREDEDEGEQREERRENGTETVEPKDADG